jgi:hypothetical protein
MACLNFILFFHLAFFSKKEILSTNGTAFMGSFNGKKFKKKVVLEMFEIFNYLFICKDQNFVKENIESQQIIVFQRKIPK